MVLIGVNEDERNQKQPVTVEFDLILGEGSNDSDVSALFDKLFSVEQRLAKVCAQQTSAECRSHFTDKSQDHRSYKLRDFRGTRKSHSKPAEERSLV